MEEIEVLRNKLRLLQQLQQEKLSWQKERESLQQKNLSVEQERDALKHELELAKNPEQSKEKKSRYSADFWVDVGDKLKHDTEAMKELIKNKTITNDDVDPDGYSLLNLAAYYGMNENIKLSVSYIL